jgi:hypothetical protein
LNAKTALITVYVTRITTAITAPVDIGRESSPATRITLQPKAAKNNADEG